MKSKRTTEDYVKTIYTLSRNGEVRRCQLAECLSVSRPTVSISIKALSEAGLVYTDDTNGIHLTESGLNIAKTVEERQYSVRFPTEYCQNSRRTASGPVRSFSTPWSG